MYVNKGLLKECLKNILMTDVEVETLGILDILAKKPAQNDVISKKNIEKWKPGKSFLNGIVYCCRKYAFYHNSILQNFSADWS